MAAPEKSELLYCLHAICARGCSRKILGPCRKASEPEHSEEVIEQFHDGLKNIGWTIVKNDDGVEVWNCHKQPCKPFPDLSGVKIPEKFKNKIKLINPDYFKVGTITNLSGDED